MKIQILALLLSVVLGASGKSEEAEQPDNNGGSSQPQMLEDTVQPTNQPRMADDAMQSPTQPEISEDVPRPLTQPRVPEATIQSQTQPEIPEDLPRPKIQSELPMNCYAIRPLQDGAAKSDWLSYENSIENCRPGDTIHFVWIQSAEISRIVSQYCDLRYSILTYDNSIHSLRRYDIVCLFSAPRKVRRPIE